MRAGRVRSARLQFYPTVRRVAVRTRSAPELLTPRGVKYRRGYVVRSDAPDPHRGHLIRVGIDQEAGFTPSLEGLEASVPSTVVPQDLDAYLGTTPGAHLLDVRNLTEHAQDHIPGSQKLNASKVMFHQDELPAQDAGPLVTYCQLGLRNSVAAGALRRAGYDVVELEGSYAGWSA